MADHGKNPALDSAISALRAHGVVPGIVTALRESRATAESALLARVLEEVSAYSESADPDVQPELRQHLAEHLDEVERLLGGSRSYDFGFVEQYTAAHADHHFPLEALLHTYRSAHRLLSTWVRDAALAVADTSAHVRRVVADAADFTIEYNGTVSTLATSAYVDRTRSLAEAEGDRRTELLNLLLSGYDEADSRAARLLRAAGYLEQRQTYCVVAARSVDPAEMQSTARAERMAAAISDVLRKSQLRSLVGVRDDLVLAVVAGVRRLSGWTAPQSLLADRLYPHLRTVGPAALIGLSNDVPSTAHVPRAAAEARLALGFASVADRVKPYAQVSLRQLLVSHAREAMQPALPVWLDDFSAADRKARNRLSDTLRAYADANMNVLQAAKRLGVHPNTIYSRVQRISDITRRDPMSYHELTEMLLALDCYE